MDRTEVKKISNLASIALTEDDIDQMQVALSGILHLVDQLQQHDVGQLEPATHPLEMQQRLREDEITEIQQREQLQLGAPAVSNGYYLVPRVIDPSN